ncbi:SRR1-like protein-like [Planoprotostelium fungivorum]|uniref:SRR1-like protein-like n=1 Tax=Planoprotostelium fungivorum TaxID=1890364 RepID=A0A2P6NUJ7_9EUKA|nr:SRR1-like protein-like [Planoprotostelium fungivorum]
MRFFWWQTIDSLRPDREAHHRCQGGTLVEEEETTVEHSPTHWMNAGLSSITPITSVNQLVNRAELQNNPIVKEATEILSRFFGKDFVEGSPVRCNVVCYGLGPFLTSPKAKYQLGLLLLLIEHLKIEGQKHYFDPIFDENEKKVLNELGWTDITENEQGKRKVEGRTFFYMPHCGRPLYNNLLYTNWEPLQLKEMIILGNGFTNYNESALGEKKKKETYYMTQILPFTTEVSLKSDIKDLNAFNDTSESS